MFPVNLVVKKRGKGKTLCDRICGASASVVKHQKERPEGIVKAQTIRDELKNRSREGRSLKSLPLNERGIPKNSHG
jgi:hypothetical protein